MINKFQKILAYEKIKKEDKKEKGVKEMRGEKIVGGMERKIYLIRDF
jgi:hypothetical protein